MIAAPPLNADRPHDRIEYEGAPRRVLMTVDAVGGVWRYAMDLGRALSEHGIEMVYACLGPAPSHAQATEAESIGALVQVDAPLDWLVPDERELDRIPALLAELSDEYGVDLLHLNLPSQAAGLELDVPVVVVSHSCVVTWFRAVRGTSVPSSWQWQKTWNAAGLRAADLVIAPSRSHASMLTRCYGPIDALEVVHNASRRVPIAGGKRDFVLAAGRWWDDGKNGRMLDLAARTSTWPVLMAGSQRGPDNQYLPIAHAQALGEVPYTKLRELMGTAGILASPSVYEPFGLAALEGALAGAALVLADIPTYRELWDGAALFAPPRDAQAFSDTINRVAGDHHLRADLRRRAQRRARYFSPEVQAEAMLGCYARAARRHRNSLQLAG